MHHLILGHMAGLPLEESALSFGPVLAVAAAGVAAYCRDAVARLRRPRDGSRR